MIHIIRIRFPSEIKDNGIRRKEIPEAPERWQEEGKKFFIDCTHPAEGGIMDSSSFESFLKERVKVETGNLGNNVQISREKTKVPGKGRPHLRHCLLQEGLEILDQEVP